MSNSNQVYTYKDLLKDLSKLNEKQLSKPVIWWGDERGGHIYDVWILEEDFVRKMQKQEN